MSKKFLAIEWAKAITGPVAVLGLLVTVWATFSQLNEARRVREDERFERAVSRIGSAQVSERLTGIAGLQQFLRSAEPERQSASLQYLVNAAVIEPDATVRGAILDIFNGLDQSETNRPGLNVALVAARDRDRAILKRYVDRYFATTKLLNGRMPSGAEFTEVPIGKLSSDERAPLETAASIIAALIRAGGKSSDLSQIYCVECKFGIDSGSVDLSHTSFDGAFLRRADFRNADLFGSSFHNADLVQTWFTSADLRQAKLTADVPATPWQELAGVFGNSTLLMFGANFACADLADADFSGRTTFTFIYHNPVISTAQDDNFSMADLRGTKLTGFQFLLAVPAEFISKSRPPGFFDIHRVFPVTTGQWAGPSQPSRGAMGQTMWFGLFRRTRTLGSRELLIRKRFGTSCWRSDSYMLPEISCRPKCQSGFGNSCNRMRRRFPRRLMIPVANRVGIERA